MGFPALAQVPTLAACREGTAREGSQRAGGARGDVPAWTQTDHRQGREGTGDAPTGPRGFSPGVTKGYQATLALSEPFLHKMSPQETWDRCSSSKSPRGKDIALSAASLQLHTSALAGSRDVLDRKPPLHCFPISYQEQHLQHTQQNQVLLSSS